MLLTFSKNRKSYLDGLYMMCITYAHIYADIYVAFKSLYVFRIKEPEMNKSIQVY